MANLYSGINTALRAIMANQQAIEVIEQNVANASTPGYRRQSVVMNSIAPASSAGLTNGGAKGVVGGGVEVSAIMRHSLDFFDSRYRLEVADAKRWEAESSVLQQVEVTLGETSSDGLVNKLDLFWSGWQALSSTPTDPSLRADLLDSAQGLVSAFNRRAT
ncbi:MAG: hypothetical protein GYA17_05045, partial [Chloroflexi bacterium]|nr:hypothetical protein [Chloroflexota bacterium]